ncbi:YtxH domain-containing protein [Streptomyces sp. NBC_00249]|uniref:YtxH domain-containing protein n=1 Tax=Streptomyces sp. NBC_00249 TaxID=2975690 RepID=UPI002258E875|nr:YtxH domain-containing protein [Streptomyces sp. NBC_00249]MCX5198080.1 YtxH domain-containing protein [Streptomyces sp. NBC_00249]
MRYKVAFVAGLALGYVIGTRAGRERYEEMKKSARRIAQNPAVRNAAETAGQTGRQFAGKAFAAVSNKVGDAVPASLSGRVRGLRARAGGGSGAEDEWGTSNT